VNTVSLDIAADMLLTGQQRLGAAAKLTVGDFEALPFADGAFDGAICLSALHHVPDIPRALREIQRVLKDDASVVFSEPGIGHSKHAQSRTEMEELGVLERDIVVTELLAECMEAGFRHVRVHPYLFPPPACDYQLWQSMRFSTSVVMMKTLWQAVVRRIRSGPGNRGSGWRRLAAITPLLGRRYGRKADTLDPPSDISLDRNEQHASEAPSPWNAWLNLRSAMEAHPVVLARKGWRQPDSRRPGILKAEITVTEAPTMVTSEGSFLVRVKVKNIGDTLWLAKPTAYGTFVTLGAKLVDTHNRLVVHNYGRGLLGADVAPGETAIIELALNAPAEPGQYRLKLDMVDECMAWFEHLGSEPTLVPLEVCLTA
jgi:hypothetical protein